MAKKSAAGAWPEYLQICLRAAVKEPLASGCSEIAASWAIAEAVLNQTHIHSLLQKNLKGHIALWRRRCKNHAYTRETLHMPTEQPC